MKWTMLRKLHFTITNKIYYYYATILTAIFGFGSVNLLSG